MYAFYLLLGLQRLVHNIDDVNYKKNHRREISLLMCRYKDAVCNGGGEIATFLVVHF